MAASRILAILVALSFALPVYAEPERRAVTAAVLDDFPPLYDIDKQGRPVGFAVDILGYVQRATDLDLEYLVVPNWAKAMEAVRDGRASFIPGIGISPAREREFLFSEEIETVPVSCFVRSDNFEISGIESLGGRRVAVIGQSAAFTKLRGRKDVILVQFSTIDSALFSLLAGDVDAFVFPEPVLLRKARLLDLEDRVKVAGKPLMELKRGYLLRKGDEALAARINPAIRAFVNSREYGAAYRKWYGRPKPFWTIRRVAVSMGGLLGISIIIMFLWRYRTIVRYSRTLAQSIVERERAEEARRDRETELRTLIDSLPQRVFFKNTELIYVFASASYAGDMGLHPKEFPGKTDFDFHSKELAEKYRSDDRSVMSARKTLEFEERYVHGDKQLTVHTVKVPVEDENGAVRGVLGIFWDITERLEMEAKLRHAQKMDAVGQLTGGVAHDFNNLLAIVLGNLELMELGAKDDPSLLDHIAKAMRAVERGGLLTQRLLAFSRQQPLEPQTVDPGELVSGMLDMLRRALGETVAIHDSLPASVWPVSVDAAQLENALINVAINARDAMPGGGDRTIEAGNVLLDEEYSKLHADVVPGEYVLLEVSDNGEGMPPEIRDQAFEPFFTTKETGKGSGLGLSMVYGFVKQSHGHVAIYSEPGQGTTIKIYLPRSTDSPGQADLGDDDPAPPKGAERILVVEDDNDVREVAAAMLAGHGYDVIEAVDGDDALDKLRASGRIDLLFTDVVLPGSMNGNELAKAAERIRPGVKTLFTTGYAKNAVVHDGRLDEGVELISKPYRKVDLIKKVQSILEG